MTRREAAVRQYRWFCSDCFLCGHSVVTPERNDTLAETGRFRCVACGIVVENVPREHEFAGREQRA